MTLGDHMTLGDTSSELTDNDRMLIEHMDIAQEGNGGGLGEIYNAVSCYFQHRGFLIKSTI